MEVEKDTEPEIVSVVVTRESYLSQFLTFEWAYDNYDEDYKVTYWLLQVACIILLFMASTVFIPMLIDHCKYRNHSRQQEEQQQEQQQEEEEEQQQEYKSKEEILASKTNVIKGESDNKVNDRTKEIQPYQENEGLLMKESDQESSFLLQKKNKSNIPSPSLDDIKKDYNKFKNFTYSEKQFLCCNEYSKLMKHIIFGSIYCLFSISLIFMNDYLVNTVFPYSATLTLFHMGSGILLSALCLYCFNLASTESLRQINFEDYMWRFFPLGLFYAAEVYCENESYEFLDVAFLQILKPFGTIMTFSFLILLKLESFTKDKGIILAVIIFSSAVAGIGASDLGEWNTTGFILALCGDFFYALYLVYSQVLLQNPILHLNPFAQLLFMGPSACLGLVLYASFVEWGDDNFQSSLEELPWWVITLDCLIAFGLNISILLVIQNLSSLSLIIVSYVKELLVVFIAWLFLPSESLNDIELEGYILEMIGLASWRYLTFPNDKMTNTTNCREETTTERFKDGDSSATIIEEDTGRI